MGKWRGQGASGGTIGGGLDHDFARVAGWKDDWNLTAVREVRSGRLDEVLSLKDEAESSIVLAFLQRWPVEFFFKWSELLVLMLHVNYTLLFSTRLSDCLFGLPFRANPDPGTCLFGQSILAMSPIQSRSDTRIC